MNISLVKYNNEFTSVNIDDFKRQEIYGLSRLVKIAAYKDNDTGLHVFRVAFYALEIASLIGINESHFKSLFYAAALHDLGKIGVPDAILKKPGVLNEEEMEKIRMHCRIGWEVFESYDYQSEIISACKDVTLFHHENYDGSGYPNGIGGEDIPLFARIVAIADVYDALTMDRCYRLAFAHQKAIEIMEKMSGKFDPLIFNIFLENNQRFRILSGITNKINIEADLYSFYG